MRTASRRSRRLDTALAETVILGIGTNIEYLRLLLADPAVQAGDLDTTLIERRLPELAFQEPGIPELAAAALLRLAALQGQAARTAAEPKRANPPPPGAGQTAGGSADAARWR